VLVAACPAPLCCCAGKIFNTACNCCQKSTTSHPIDLTSCSSSSSSSSAGTNTLKRKLLGAESASAQPADTQTIQEPQAAAAAAAASAGLDDSTVIYNAATGVATDSSGHQLPLPQRRAGPPAFGTWSTYGKHYSMGPFAGSNIVKEPAFSTPRAAAAEPAKLPTSSSSSGSRGVNNEIGSRPVAAAAKLAVYTEDETPAAAAVTGARALLEQQEQQQQEQQQQGSRQLSMKRMPPKAANQPAAAAAAAAEPRLVRTANAPPSAAKALTPDDVDVPFVTASIDSVNKQHTRKGQPARLMQASGSSSSSSSEVGRDIIDMGQLTGPEAESARREFAAAPPVHVNPTIVALPDYMQGKDSPYRYEGLRGKHSTRGHKGYGSHYVPRDSYDSHSLYSHGHSKKSYRKKSETKGSSGSHYESRQYGPHESSSSSKSYYKSRHGSHFRYEDEGADSAQQ
jgi:hypothetical protein